MHAYIVASNHPARHGRKTHKSHQVSLEYVDVLVLCILLVLAAAKSNFLRRPTASSSKLKVKQANVKYWSTFIR